jgi:hypothetical protein
VSVNKAVASPLFKRAMTVAKEIGLTTDERHELAQMIPTTDRDFDGSWRRLDESQMKELISMLEGYIYIRYLALIRPPALCNPGLMP